MTRSFVLGILAAILGFAQQSRVESTAGGWTLTADPATSTISITHERFGPVLENAHLRLRDGGGVHDITGWTARASSDDGVFITTSQPRMGWRIKAAGDLVEISTTSAKAELAGETPAGEKRMIVRLLDPEGAPVVWKGTDEAREAYGGNENWQPSFLPRKNSDCMYFSLGAPGGSGFHSLFDRATDTALRFPEDTLLARKTPAAATLNVTVPVPGNAVIKVLPDYFTRVLGATFYVPFDDSVFKTAPGVWSSWTSYYAEVTEQDIVRNADWIAEHLKPYGFEYVELDDGYDRGPNGEHYWIENWDKKSFPHGPEWLTRYIKSKGLRPGIWLVPNAYAGALKTHPEWYLRDTKGDHILDYNTPALDYTNPEVLEFERRLFKTLNGWGFEYYKFDGEQPLLKYVPNLDHSKLYDRNADPVMAYRNRVAVIRDTIGPSTFVEGCPAGTPMEAIGYYDSFFTGHDLYNNWQGQYPIFSSINANAFINHIVAYVMPGEGMELGLPMTVEETSRKRPPSVVRTARTRESPMTGFGTTDAEARTVVTYVALTGVAYPMASVMPELPPERVKLLKATLPTLPIYPMDLFSRGTDMHWDTFKHTTPDTYIHNYPEILDVKVNGAPGVYDVVALTNWRGARATRQVSLAQKLGLDPRAEYVVFDFWSQKMLGPAHGTLNVDIEPHDTRVLLIHRAAKHPQYVGTSRHISGAYSIKEVTWNAAAHTLTGVSETIAGEPYTVWVYVPSGSTLRDARAATGAGTAVKADTQLQGNSLRVTFDGQPAPVRWTVEFSQ